MPELSIEGTKCWSHYESGKLVVMCPNLGQGKQVVMMSHLNIMNLLIFSLGCLNFKVCLVTYRSKSVSYIDLLLE